MSEKESTGQAAAAAAASPPPGASREGAGARGGGTGGGDGREGRGRGAVHPGIGADSRFPSPCDQDTLAGKSPIPPGTPPGLFPPAPRVSDSPTAAHARISVSKIGREKEETPTAFLCL